MSVTWVQLTPPLAVSRTSLSVVPIQPWVALTKLALVSESLRPAGVMSSQLAPPSVVPRITPPDPVTDPPQAQPCWASGKLTDHRSASEPVGWAAQVAPSVRAVQNEPAGTDRPEVASVGEGEGGQPAETAGGLRHLPEPALGAVGYEGVGGCGCHCQEGRS